MGKYKIIANPISGRGSGARAVPAIEGLLRDHGLTFDITLTERPWHAAELARQAALSGYEYVVAAGGDGTANEVLNGLIDADQEGVAMGILCVGRGNDFAYGAGIPTDLAAGCQTLAQGHRQTMDVGRVTGGLYPQGRYFGNGVGIGFDAVVGFEAVKLTRLGGFLSYLVAVLKTVFLYFKAPLTQIEMDGETITQPSLMVSVMNGRRMGGGFMMAPEGRTDDGLLDLCIAHQVSRPGILALIPHFVRGTQAGQAAIRIGRARRVVVTALDGSLPAHADGETLCTDGQQLVIESVPGRIQILSQSGGHPT